MKTFLASVIGVSCAFAITGIAEAQEALEEIIVTAQKRAESLQDVAISIEAVTGDTIAEQSIVRLDDLDVLVPNLTITEGFTGNTLNIRGIGTAQGNAGLEQSVATFKDGVYVGRSRQSINPLMDVKQVEVLRGPQPTFFGQNAVAGALNITTRDGKGPQEANVLFSYGADNEIISEAGITIPMSDTAGLRLAGRYTDRDGYLDNIANPGEGEASLETMMVRGTFNIDLLDNFDFKLSAEYGESEQDGVSVEVVDCGLGGYVPPGPPFIFCQIEANVFPEFADPLLRSTGDQVITNGGSATMPFGRSPSVPVATDLFSNKPDTTDSFLISGTFNYDFGPATLTGITAYSEYDYFGYRDIDGTSFAVNSPHLFEDYTQTSQELRITSNKPAFNGFLDYMFGFYYQDAEIETQNITHNLIGQPPTLPSYTATGTQYRSDETYTNVFVAFTGHVSDSLRARLGLRYTDVEKEGSTNRATRDFTLDSGYTAPVVASPVLPGHSADIDTNDLSFQIGLEWDAMENLMVFATYTDAFKAGGLAQSGRGLPLVDGFTFGDEKSENIELGLKSTFADGRGRFNATAFHTEFSNLQVTSFDINLNAFVTKNAAEATSQGIEFDGDFLVTDNFSVTYSGSWLDAGFDSFPGAQCSQFEQSLNQNGCTFGALGGGTGPVVATTDRSGKDLLFSPEWNFVLGGRYSVVVGDNMELTLSGNVNFTDGYEVSDRYDPRGRIDGYEIVNLRAELAFADGKYSISAYGNNITDETPLILFGPARFGGQQAGFNISGRGASYGVQLRTNFGE